MTNELVEFIRARLDEDEKLATAAASLCGCHPEPFGEWRFCDDDYDGRIVIAGNPHPGVKHRLTKRWNGDYNSMYAARHIARHDPSRVLREVQAKRRLLADLVPSVSGMESQIDGEWGPGPGYYEKHGIERPKDDSELLLQLLAAPYADHPDHQAHWAT